ncbi:MAG: S-layer homology domain-containing protein, partial [Fervidobacterium nodosum]
MKKRSCLLLIKVIFVFFFSITSVFAATIKDLSPSASDYKAVNALVDMKILDVDSNGNFKPSLLITKLDLARYLYNLIDYYNLNNLSRLQTSLGDVVTSSDLKKLDSKISGLDSRISGVEKQIQSIQSSQNNLQDTVKNLQVNINEMAKKIDSLEKKISAPVSTPSIPSSYQETLTSLQKSVNDLKTQLSNNEKQLSTIKQQISVNESSIE